MVAVAMAGHSDGTNSRHWNGRHLPIVAVVPANLVIFELLLSLLL
jgi:hypothetical protein